MPNPSSGGECIKSHSPLDFPDFGGDFFPPEVFPFEVVCSEEWHLDQSGWSNRSFLLGLDEVFNLPVIRAFIDVTTSRCWYMVLGYSGKEKCIVRWMRTHD